MLFFFFFGLGICLIQCAEQICFVLCSEREAVGKAPASLDPEGGGIAEKKYDLIVRAAEYCFG